MFLTCIRHAATRSNREGRYGRADEALANDERLRLQDIAFDPSDFDAVYSSPFRRCIETADALGIDDYAIDGRLAERDFGVFTGLTAAECEEAHADAFRAFLKFDAAFEIPGGESRAQHHARLEDWLKTAVQRQNVLAVTHGGAVDFLYRMAHGLDRHGGPRIHSASNASITTLEITWPTIKLLSFDRSL